MAKIPVFFISLLFFNQSQAGCAVHEISQGQYLLSHPSQMVATADGNQVFLLDELAGNVNRINTTEKFITEAITVGGEPTALALDEAQQRLYVADMFNGNIQVIDYSGQPAKLINTKNISELKAGALLWDAARGQLIVSNSKDASILLLTPDLIEKKRIQGTKQTLLAHDMVLLNSTLYVSYEGSHQVGVYDLNQGQLQTTIGVDKNPTDMVLSATGSMVYVLNSGNSSLSIIDTQKQSKTKTIVGLDYPVTMALVGERLWIAGNGRASLQQFDVKNEVLLAQKTCNEGIERPADMVVLPQRNKVYLSHQDSVSEVVWGDGFSFSLKCDADSAFKPITQANIKANESCQLQIDGGSGVFNITTQSTHITLKQGNQPYLWQLTAGNVGDSFNLNVTDKTSNEVLTLFTTIVADMELKANGKTITDFISTSMGQTLVFSVAGGQAPYTWAVKSGSGELSTTTGAQVVYKPTKITLTGQADVVNVSDGNQSVKSININVLSVDGVSISPSTAVVEPNKEVKFYALGGQQYEWQVTAGRIDRYAGEQVLFTAPNETGEVGLLVTDPSTGKTAQAFIYVVTENLTINPFHKTLDLQGTVVFQVLGGHPPYTWTASEGDFTSYQAPTTTYVAPKLIRQAKITVKDNGGRSATAQVEVNSHLLLSPATAVVYAGETIKFTLARAEAEAHWTVSGGGEFKQTSPLGAEFIAPMNVGPVVVGATDGRGDYIQSIVFVISKNLYLSHNYINNQPPAGQTIRLGVEGGTPPYIWSTTMGVLSASEGKSVFFTTPTRLSQPQEEVAVTVEDGTDLLAAVHFDVQNQQDCQDTAPCVAQTDKNIKINLPALTAEQAHYVAIALPQNPLLWVFTDLNQFIAFDPQQLPAWQGTQQMLDFPLTENLPKGTYTVYLLHMPIGMNPMANLDKGQLTTRSFTLE